MVTAGALVGLALVLALTWLRRRPQRGILALVALAPFHGLLPLVTDDRIVYAWKEALVLATFLAAVIAAARRGPIRGNPIPFLPYAVSLALLGSASALMTFGLVGVIAIKITFFYMLIVAIIWLAPLSRSEIDIMVTTLMVVAGIASVYAVIQQFIGPERLVEWGYEYNENVRFAGGFMRAFSTFDAPFAFALFVMLVLLLGIPIALADAQRLRNRVFLVAAPFLAAAMTLAIVRAAILGLVVGLLWIGIVRYRALFWTLVLAVPAVLGVVAALLPQAFGAVASGSSFEERKAGWSVQISEVIDHPFGRGLGSLGSAGAQTALAEYPEYVRDLPPAVGANIIENLPYQPDNYYIKILLELGPVGLWLFLGVLVTAILLAIRVAHGAPDPAMRALGLGASAFLIAAALASLVATFLEIYPLDVYFWLLLGVLASIPMANHEVGRTSDRPPIPATTASTVPRAAPPDEHPGFDR